MTGPRPLLAALGFAVALTVAAPAAVLPVPARADTAAAATRPNIVFVLTDDMALPDLAAMPSTTRLVGAGGATFEDAFVSDSSCCPSRATILTGRYAHNTGVFSNGGDNGGFETAHRLGVERHTIATRLHRAGYRTGLFGKYLNGYPNGVNPDYVPPGWTSWAVPVAGSPYFQYEYTLNVDGSLVAHGRTPSDYGTDVYASHARRFIRTSARAGVPFFAALSVYAPHLPAVPAPVDTKKFKRARAPHTPSFDQAEVDRMPGFVRDMPRFDAPTRHVIDAIHRKRLRSLQAVDRAVGSLVDTLRREHQLDNTYIVFSSDNGFHLGQHRLPAGKFSAYEPDVRVPLLIRGPGVPAGTHVRALAVNVDLAPTFAAMAGVAFSGSDGRSVLDLARDPMSASTWPRTDFLIEHRTEVGSSDPVRPDDLPVEPADPDGPGAGARLAKLPRLRETNHRSKSLIRLSRGIPDYDAVRTRRWVYVEYETGDRELYDLVRDPDETRNLAGRAHRPLERRLARRLDELRHCAGATCRAPAASP